MTSYNVHLTFFLSSSAPVMSMNSETVEPHVWVMFIIFFTSLFAASFPTLSKQIPILRIPTIVFFIGKHFGTGVILTTAFTHLLDDAFRSLQDPLVKIRYGDIGKRTGLIILGSLLIIFLIEYISTSYVDYLQSKPSEPPSPISSCRRSRPASLKSLSRPISYQSLSNSAQIISTNAEFVPPTQNTEPALLTETTHLLPSTQPTPLLSRQPRQYVSTTPTYKSRDHSAHSYHHHVHHIYTPITPPAAFAGVPIDILTNSSRIFRQLGLNHSHAHGNVCSDQENEREGSDYIHHDHIHEHYSRIGRRRQVIGILVLQFGIMIHSLVVGLTLAVTYGSDFTSLTTAILFHQLFEGLSLGIRIASLPPNHKEDHINVGDDERLLSTAPLTPSLPPTCYVPNLEPDPGTLSDSTPRHACINDDSNYSNNGKRMEVSWVKYLWAVRAREFHWFKPTLSFLFAVTTPFGMGMGMIMWNEKDGSDKTQMLLIQGTMSAISTGMLIYAGTVEMLAGDFVFGDVDGGHGHGHHHHPHPHLHLESGSHAPFDNHDDHQPHIPGQSMRSCDDWKRHQEEPSGTVMKKVLAVLSLFAGVAGMVVIG